MAPEGGERAYVALGSNLGDRAGYLQAARDALARLPGTRLVAASDVEETAPIGPMPQPRYLNQMVLIETALTPRELLEACHTIEHAEGRVRGEHWGARTLDLDIVRFGRPPRGRARPYHSPSRAAQPRLLAARAGGAAIP